MQTFAKKRLEIVIEHPARKGLTAILDAHRLQNLDVAARRIERHDAGLIDGGNESIRRTIHDRHFRGVQLDGDVVHALADQVRHVAPIPPYRVEGDR